MKSSIRIFVHCLSISAMIIHISLCSEYFEGSALWAYLTYLCELLFLLVSLQFFTARVKLNSIEKYGLFYFTFIVAISILNELQNSNLIALMGRFMEISTVLMIVHIHKNNLNPIIMTCTFTLSVLVYVNFYNLLENPSGMINSSGEPYFLLGTNYNQIGTKILFAFLFSIISSKINKYFILNNIGVGVLGLASVLIVGSMTSVVCLSILMFAYLLSWNHKVNKLVFWTLSGFFCFFQIFIVFGGEHLSGDIFLNFLNSIGKDSTFTGRTSLWERSSFYFWDSPILGHGFITPSDYADSPFFHGDARNSHNYVYNLLHKGGIVLFFIVYKLLSISFRKIKSSFDYGIGYMIVISSVIFFIMSLFECYDSFWVFMILVLMFYFPFYSKQKNVFYENR